MTLIAGQSILHCRLLEKIGEGGMGVVWKAVDTTLDREVAIKILPELFARDPDRLARFEREAKLLAALNHPNLAAIHGFHEAEGIRFITMELVEGETLAEWLRRRHKLSISIAETLEICRQIAEALEAAHDRGIVHRDLKPANVMVRPDGTVKVLDFGLARENAPVSGSSPEALTATAHYTEPGAVLGTAPYMSPEQARGTPADKRTDIWSLGCILYEGLSGMRPFQGATATDTLAQIVSQPPDFEKLPQDTPDTVARLVRRCLEKDPRRRLRDAGEVRVAIEQLQSSPSAETRERASEPVRRLRSGTLIPWLLIAILGVALASSLVRRSPRSEGPDTGVTRWSIPLPPESRLGLATPGGGFDFSRLLAVSPDGKHIVYSVQNDEQVEFYLRDTGTRDPRPIPGTLEARGPFFSPDGKWLGFLSNDYIRKVSLAGGSPQIICEIGNRTAFDATWSPNGETIVFATDDGLWQVPSAGGPPEQLTRPDADRGETGHHSPRFAPDGKSVWFTVSVTPDTHLARLSLGTGTWEVLVHNASQGVPLDEGRILFARKGELLVVPYDAGSGQVTGTPMTVLEGVFTTPGLGGVVLAHFDVSTNGTLVYSPGRRVEQEDQLVWVDWAGQETLITGGPGKWVHPRLSPDGSRISLDIHTSAGMRDVYIYEIAMGQMNRLTRSGFTWESEWHPDGQILATLSADTAGQWSLFTVATDFSRAPELLYHSPHAVPVNWSPDGSFLLFHELIEGGIWKIAPGENPKPELLVGTAANERFPSLSPDGHWIAFVADESGRREVFVQPFPELGSKHKISIDGGGEPRWSPDGRRLFFREQDRMLMVEVETAPTFYASRPRVLFEGKYDSPASGHQHYDISHDGRKFLMIKSGPSTSPNQVWVAQNWLTEIDRAVPKDIGD